MPSFEWDDPPRVIGHRGAPREAPENTRASFEAAIAAGVRAVEFDVRASADGVPVVHHDLTLGRVIPGEGRIDEMTARDLAALGIPTLFDVLRLPILLDVEIKPDGAHVDKLPALVHEAVARAGATDRVLVTSFDAELADAYARLAGRPAGMILPFPPDADELASFPRLRFVALAEEAALPEALEPCAKLDRRVLVWTVNDEASARALLGQGFASIITDQPKAFVRAFG